MSEKIRINKFLSDAGVCSRREADRLIEEGRVTVNGKTAVPGEKTDGGDCFHRRKACEEGGTESSASFL